MLGQATTQEQLEEKKGDDVQPGFPDAATAPQGMPLAHQYAYMPSAELASSQNQYSGLPTNSQDLYTGPNPYQT